jgi:hypothetical protein
VIGIDCSKLDFFSKRIIWIDSKQKDSLLADKFIHELIQLRLYSENFKYELKDVRSLFDEHPLEVDSKISKNIIFEPFSFHIIEDERSIVGIQIITILLLFFVSGLIIGFWWAKR